MLQVPDWLFVILVVLSVLLLVFIGTCLVILIYKQLQKRNRYRIIDNRKIKTPYFSFTNYDDHVHYSYLPHTYPVTVQNGKRPPSMTGSDSDTATSVFQSPREKFPDESSRLQRGASLDESELTGSCRRKVKSTELKRPASMMLPVLDMKERLPSQVSGSRKSSLGSELENDKKETVVVSSPEQRKAVYLHSSLLGDTVDQPDNVEHVFSYDQNSGSQAKRYPYGALLFSFLYDAVVTELTISVKRAIDLPTLDEDQEYVNSYVNVCIVPEDFYWQRTSVVENTSDPIFNETFHIPDVLHHKLRQYSLCFLVMDSNKVYGERLIGKVIVPLSDLRAGVTTEMCKELARG